MAEPQSDFRRFSFRLPPALFQSLEADAKRHNRSINAEIISQLSTRQGCESDLPSLLRAAADKLEKGDFPNGSDLREFNEGSEI